MSRLLRRLAVTAAIALAAGPAMAASKIEQAKVRHPGLVLFDPAKRAPALDAARPVAAKFCGLDAPLPPLVDPVRKLEEREGYGADDSAEDFSLAVMRLAGRMLAGDREASRQLVEQLRAWADEKALRKTDDDNPATLLALKRMLLPTIQAVALADREAAFDEDTRKDVYRWLEKLVRKADTRFGGDSMTDENNHRYMRDAVNMAWGAYKGSDDYFQKGIARYVEALEQLRPDGSWPHETSRGARALWYMRQSIANLVAIAEIGATQGQDLYGIERKGRDLHAAIKFLLDGIDDPSVVMEYAKENHVPGPSDNWRVQDLGFLSAREHGRHYMAWAEAYMQRFPDHPNTRRLTALLQRRGGFDTRPLVDDFTGGNATCFWAPVERSLAAD